MEEKEEDEEEEEESSTTTLENIGERKREAISQTNRRINSLIHLKFTYP